MGRADYGYNFVQITTLNITTPPAGSADPRRTGVRTTGAYWGAAPEQIDVLSGNTNFSIPLIRAQARYAYDGFGNLTDATTTKGSTPELHTSYDAATNHGYCSHANGNSSEVACAGSYSGYQYDIENRIALTGTGLGSVHYNYAPGNKRLWRGAGSFDSNTQQWTTDEVTYWSPAGQKMATYQLVMYQGVYGGSPASLYCNQTGTNYYFGSKLLKNAGGWVYTDRLGSIGKYFPYGQERPSATTDGKEKFATYCRDSETGLDYAQNRYHQPGMGRFMTPDPWNGSGKPNDPGSWNAMHTERVNPSTLLTRMALVATIRTTATFTGIQTLPTATIPSAITTIAHRAYVTTAGEAEAEMACRPVRSSPPEWDGLGPNCLIS